MRDRYLNYLEGVVNNKIRQTINRVEGYEPSETRYASFLRSRTVVICEHKCSRMAHCLGVKKSDYKRRKIYESNRSLLFL